MLPPGLEPGRVSFNTAVLSTLVRGCSKPLSYRSVCAFGRRMARVPRAVAARFRVPKHVDRVEAGVEPVCLPADASATGSPRAPVQPPGRMHPLYGLPFAFYQLDTAPCRAAMNGREVVSKRVWTGFEPAPTPASGDVLPLTPPDGLAGHPRVPQRSPRAQGNNFRPFQPVRLLPVRVDLSPPTRRHVANTMALLCVE